MQNLITTSNPLENITRIDYKGQPVLTTAQLADILTPKDEAGDPIGKPVTANNLKLNFRNNQARFIEGKHFFKLEGEELATLKDEVKNLNLVAPNVNTLYLWTKRGCARHCKSVGTDVAWEVFETLEDTYFAVVGRDKPLKSISDFERGKELVKVLPHAKDPYTKKRLVAKAANLLLDEEFVTVPDSEPMVQLTLFK